MSEIMQARRNDIRKRLLATASAFALFAVHGAQNARAEDGADTPLVWIELGGQFEAVNDAHGTYIPSFSAVLPRPSFESNTPTDLQRGPRLGWDADFKLAFQPTETDWVLSASVRYGRAVRTKDKHQQPPPTYHYSTPSRAFGPYSFYQAGTRTLSSHAIADFQAGRDVGLGMFGLRGNSVFSLGVRYANFDSVTDTQISSQPSVVRCPVALCLATAHVHRRFAGVGPSLSWDASAPILGSGDGGSVDLDWGANAAILFGKQSATGSHHSNEIVGSISTHPFTFARRRARSVPNVGGYAAISYRLHDVKLSLGYRADIFFRAVDGGIDSAKDYDRGFYGPFAKISVGIGG